MAIPLFSHLTSHLFAFVLVIVMPVLNRGAWARKTKIEGSPDPERKRRVLLQSVVRKWCFAALLLLAWIIDDPGDLPVLVAHPLIWWIVAEVVVLAIVGRSVIPIRMRSPAYRARTARTYGNIGPVLPRTPEERRVYVLVAVTAGITEEIAYRAFLIPYLAWLLPGRGLVGAVVLTSIISGLINATQGWKGVLQTGLMSAFVGVVFVVGGLLAPMVIHTLTGLGILLVPPDLIDERDAVAAARQSSPPDTEAA